MYGPLIPTSIAFGCTVSSADGREIDRILAVHDISIAEDERAKMRIAAVPPIVSLAEATGYDGGLTARQCCAGDPLHRIENDGVPRLSVSGLTAGDD